MVDNNVYKLIELTGSSGESIEDAINRAVGRASGTVHDLRWFEVSEIRGAIDRDHVRQWQVTIKVGFVVGD